MSNKYICSCQVPVMNRRGKLVGLRVSFVSELRGDGGVDWGYTSSSEKALLMTERMAKIFVNEGPKYRFMTPMAP